MFKSFIWMIWTDFLSILFNEISFFLERFASNTIKPLIDSLINISTIICFLKYFLDKSCMCRARRTDKVCITYRKFIPNISMFKGHHICIFHHFHILKRCRLDDFLRVLINTSRKLHICSFETFISSNDISEKRSIRISYMWDSIRIINRRRNEKFLRHKKDDGIISRL